LDAKPVTAADAVVTPPFCEVSCKLDGALHATFANGEPLGVSAPVLTVPAADTGIVTVDTPPVATLLMVQTDVTVALIWMSCVAACAQHGDEIRSAANAANARKKSRTTITSAWKT
jgi:hypothetical protein